MKKFLMGLVAGVVVLGGILVPNVENKVYADGDGAVILSDCWSQAEENGQSGITCVLKLAVNILTAVVGVLGVIGIVIVGIQYLTAGGNEAQLTKAKRRMLEIVIGLAVYAASYALLNWLLPGFSESSGDNSDKKTTSSLIIEEKVG